MILDERFEEFQGKHGHQRVRRLALQDLSRPMFISGLDYEPKGDDAKKLPEGDCVGKTITLGIRNMRQAFGGRFTLDAVLVANGEPAGGSKGSPVGK